MQTQCFWRPEDGFGEKRMIFEFAESDGGIAIPQSVKRELDTKKETRNPSEPPANLRTEESPTSEGHAEPSPNENDERHYEFDLDNTEITEETFDQRQKSASEQVLEMYHRLRPGQELKRGAFGLHSQKELVTRKIDELNRNYRNFGENLWRTTIDRIRITNERAIQQLRVLSEREIRAGEILQELKERKDRVSAKSKKLQALAKQIGISRPLLKIAAGFAGAREGINATLRTRSAEEKANGVFYKRLADRAEKDVTAIRSEASAEAKRLHAMLEKRFKDENAKREGIINYLIPENDQGETKKRQLQEMISAYVTKPDIYSEDEEGEKEKQRKREELQKKIDNIQDVGDRRMVQILLKSMQPRLAGIRKTPAAAKYHETIHDIRKTAQKMKVDKAEYEARGKLDTFFAKHSLKNGDKIVILFYSNNQNNLSDNWEVTSVDENEYHLKNTENQNATLRIAKTSENKWKIIFENSSRRSGIDITSRLRSISLPSII